MKRFILLFCLSFGLFLVPSICSFALPYYNILSFNNTEIIGSLTPDTWNDLTVTIDLNYTGISSGGLFFYTADIPVSVLYTDDSSYRNLNRMITFSLRFYPFLSGMHYSVDDDSSIVYYNSQYANLSLSSLGSIYSLDNLSTVRIISFIIHLEYWSSSSSPIFTYSCTMSSFLSVGDFEGMPYNFYNNVLSLLESIGGGTAVVPDSSKLSQLSNVAQDLSSSVSSVTEFDQQAFDSYNSNIEIVDIDGFTLSSFAAPFQLFSLIAEFLFDNGPDNFRIIITLVMLVGVSSVALGIAVSMGRKL